MNLDNGIPPNATILKVEDREKTKTRLTQEISVDGDRYEDLGTQLAIALDITNDRVDLYF